MATASCRGLRLHPAGRLLRKRRRAWKGRHCARSGGTLDSGRGPKKTCSRKHTRAHEMVKPGVSQKNFSGEWFFPGRMHVTCPGTLGFRGARSETGSMGLAVPLGQSHCRAVRGVRVLQAAVCRPCPGPGGESMEMGVIVTECPRHPRGGPSASGLGTGGPVSGHAGGSQRWRARGGPGARPLQLGCGRGGPAPSPDPTCGGHS